MLIKILIYFKDIYKLSELIASIYMMFFFYIFSLKSLEFTLNDQNIEELANKSMETPVFILFRSPHCPHCQKIHPTWELLQTKYKNETGIIIADTDCVAFPKACKYFMTVNAYPTFAIIIKNETSKTLVERKLESWSNLIDKIRLFGPNYRCKMWLEQADVFPFFIFTTTKGAEETCDEILEIVKQLPKSKGLIYSNPNGTEYSCQINMNEQYSYIYSNQTNYTVFIPFVKEFLLHPFGDWDISEAAESDRRIGFFIYDDNRTLKRFSDIVFNQSAEFAFTKIEYEKFNNMFPKIELEKSELPALGVSNYKHSHFLLMTNVKVNDELYKKLDKIASGSEDNNMTFSMSKLMNVNSNILDGDYDQKDLFNILLIVIIVIIFIILWRKLSPYKQKVGGEKRRRNDTLSKAYNELKLFFHEKCSFKKQKVPASLL